MAQKVANAASRRLPAPERIRIAQQTELEWFQFEGMEERIPSPAYCRDYEFCCTLDDYLRRRTNISQWIPQDGLGLHQENRPLLERIAAEINGGNLSAAEEEVARYAANVGRRRERALSTI